MGRTCDPDHGRLRRIDPFAPVGLRGRPTRRVMRMDCAFVSDGRPAASITVLVVEADAATRDAWVAMIHATPDMSVWAATPCRDVARALLAATPGPDVAIVDLGLADDGGAALIADLAARSVGTVSLVSAVSGEETQLMRAFEAGARGCVLKGSSTQDLARAVRLAHEGDAPLPPRVAARLLDRLAALSRGDCPAMAGQGDAPERLSTREAEILSLIAQGHTVGDVAQRLHRSHHTVSTHVKHIYEKLAVSNRMQAINRARQTGQIA